MKKLTLMIVMLALGLVGWKTKDMQGASMENNTQNLVELSIATYDNEDSLKLKEVKLKLSPGAGDVAKIQLLSVKDSDGGVILEKFVPNNTTATLKFKVKEDLNTLQVNYGKIDKELELVNGIAQFNFRK